MNSRFEIPGTSSENETTTRKGAPTQENNKEGYGIPPENWWTFVDLYREFRIHQHTVTNRMEEHIKSHPEWFGKFKNKAGRPNILHFSPEFVKVIEKEYASQPKRKVDWLTLRVMSEKLGKHPNTIKKDLSQYKETHPEWFQSFKGRGGHRDLPHYSIKLLKKLRNIYEAQHRPRPGSKTPFALARELKTTPHTIRKTAKPFLQKHPEWSEGFLSGNEREYYAPELVQLIKKDLAERLPHAPDNWESINSLAEKLRRSRTTIKEIAKPYLQKHPEWSRFYLTPGGNAEHYSLELTQKITHELAIHQSPAEQKRKESELENFAAESAGKEMLSSTEFGKLINLFGGANAADILFLYRPEFKGVKIEHVKKVLAEYLGDFLVAKKKFKTSDLEYGVKYLSDPSLCDGLIIIIKGDCLAYINQERKSGSKKDERELAGEYIKKAREETRNLQSNELNQILQNVESYYRGLFEISKPPALKDSLKDGRQFPDINQRINIKELANKKKILIADEMGLGKSASAILAKESLDLKRALVVAPSNVISTWTRYLSDNEGGYFKSGSAPKVLVIKDPSSLETDPSGYDYVVISQEKLNARYAEWLEKMEFDMLVVDEVHKLKNLKSGKRAARVIELAELIQGESKYLSLLSGTPAPNMVEDIAMILKLLYPEKFKEMDNDRLVQNIIRGDLVDIRGLLVPRMQMKSLTESIEIPPLTERVVTTTLSPEEQGFYDTLVEEGDITATEKIRILRQFLLNPNMLAAVPSLESSKLHATNEALGRAFQEHKKVVMFINGYVENVIRGQKSIIPHLSVPMGVEIKTIEGTVSRGDRERIQEELKEPDKKILLVVSGQTADVGVDFSAADHVIFYNEPWTRYDQLQQLGRVYREGTEHSLTSETLVVENSIEEGIHKYIGMKQKIIEKLLGGIPRTELERRFLERDEKMPGAGLEVDPELAKYYLASWDKMMEIFKKVKGIGEENFYRFLQKFGREYAEYYKEIGNRSYQANGSRVSGTIIDMLMRKRKQDPSETAILDVASGPEVLKKHIPDRYRSRVFSVDINAHHFSGEGRKRMVGSFAKLPIQEKSIDYANLAFSLHYTQYRPSQERYERIQVLQELNRVLKMGGVCLINLIYSRDVADQGAFQKIVQSLGFRIREEYSGEVTSGDSYQSTIFSLEKIADANGDLETLVSSIDPEVLKGLKLKKTKTKIGNSKKIIRDFQFKNSKFAVIFNKADESLYQEEQDALSRGRLLKTQYTTIEGIPEIEVVTNGFSRVSNGRKQILFKKLSEDNGVVIIK